MSTETLLLKWMQLNVTTQFYDCAEGKQFRLEKQLRKDHNKLVKEHEATMTEQGFEFTLTGISLPNGEKYEL